MTLVFMFPKQCQEKEISHLMSELFKKDAVFLAAMLSTHVMKMVIRRVPMEKESLRLIV